MRCRNLADSFRHACAGLRYAFQTQRNMFVHLAAAAAAFAAGAYFQISIFEYCLVVLAIAIVAVAELVNTAIEATVDLASPQLDPLAKAAKDLSAAAVLVAAVSAAGLGVLVFLPHALGLLTR